MRPHALYMYLSLLIYNTVDKTSTFVYYKIKDECMKWEVTTTKKRHVVECNSSQAAVLKVKETDNGMVIGCKVLPKTTVGKIKRIWSNWVGK